MKRNKEWSVYILRCAGGSLYTGIAKDVVARLARHKSGKGAAYTRSRKPGALVYREDRLTHSQALKREWAIKQLKKAEKEKLILISVLPPVKLSRKKLILPA